MEVLSDFGNLREFLRESGLAALCTAPPMCVTLVQITEDRSPMHRASHPVRRTSIFHNFSPSSLPLLNTTFTLLTLCSLNENELLN